MIFQFAAVFVGLVMSAVVLWQTHSLLALVPAVLLVVFGLLLDDGSVK